MELKATILPTVWLFLDLTLCLGRMSSSLGHDAVIRFEVRDVDNVCVVVLPIGQACFWGLHAKYGLDGSVMPSRARLHVDA